MICFASSRELLPWLLSKELVGLAFGFFGALLAQLLVDAPLVAKGIDDIKPLLSHIERRARLWFFAWAGV